MAQWGRNDQSVTANSSTTVESSTGAPIGTYALVKGDQVNRVDGANAHFGNTSSGSRAGVDVNMFGNTTQDAFITGKAVGVFGVDATEKGIVGGPLALTYVTNGGSGYSANAVATLTFANGSTNATAVNAFANVTAGIGGHITSLNIAQSGSGYTANPTLSIAAPSAINLIANSTGFANGTVAGASNSSFIISTANSKFQAGDRLYYGVPAANTPIAPLTGNTYYYVSFANTTVIKLATTATGANITITDTRVLGAAETHTFTGDTATGYVVVSGGGTGVAHAGWVLRTEGSGGRAGRVQYETLVAMGSLGAQTAAFGTPATTADASDDTFLPDS
jgi:hypothetical protein